MFIHRTFYLLLIMTILVVTACTPAPQITEQPAATSTESVSITLRLGIPDEDNVLYAPYILEFIEQVKMLSNEGITIEPIWNAGDNTDVKYEKGVIQLVREGNVDLGLAASRAWDPIVFTNLQVLQTPFLITDDALADAVATSDIATRVLDSLSSGGVVGLTLWPEDLRHPFSVDPANPILTPEDFVGQVVRTTDTSVSEMLIKTLGGTPIFEASNYQAAESGLLQGATLTGRPAATGNVTLFPKYQVLFANGAMFNGLSEEQRNILRQAAFAAQRKAIAERPGEFNASSSWCADGGTIVMASEEQITAFEKAAQPVYSLIAQDSLNTDLILAIRELKSKTKASPGAEACAPAISTETQVFSEGVPPNGVWQVELNIEDFARMGVSQVRAENWGTGLYTWTFQDGEAHLDWKGEANKPPYDAYTCQADYAVVGNVVRFKYNSSDPVGTCDDAIEDIQWYLNEDGLHFYLVNAQGGPFLEVKAVYEAKPWQKIENP